LSAWEYSDLVITKMGEQSLIPNSVRYFFLPHDYDQ